jgi:hypothetical protein
MKYSEKAVVVASTEKKKRGKRKYLPGVLPLSLIVRCGITEILLIKLNSSVNLSATFTVAFEKYLCH